MTELSFTPTFHHAEWVDNVDRIRAGGPNGFNVRLNAIEADLRTVGTIIDEIDTAIDDRSAGGPPLLRLVNAPVRLVSLADAGQGGWFYHEDGSAHPAPGTGGGVAVMDLDLPDSAKLVSFRLLGLYPGAPATLTISMLRASLSNPAQTPDVLGTLTSSVPGLTNPYDVTVPIDPAFATVDNGGFRYLLSATARQVTDSTAISLAAAQIRYLGR
jgi:hypothetical protein